MASFQLKEYIHHLETAKRYRTEIPAQDLKGCYRKSYTAFLQHLDWETDQVIVAMFQALFPEGKDCKEEVLEGLRTQEDSFRNVYRMARRGEELPEIYLAIGECVEKVIQSVKEKPS